MNDIEIKIAELRKQVEAQAARLRRSAAVTAAIYGLLVLFVLGYTTYVFNAIEEKCTPENVASLLVMQIHDFMPSMLDNMRQRMKPTADELAGRSVDAMAGAIPQVGSAAREYLSTQASVMLDEFESKNMPMLTKFLNDGIAEVMKNKDSIKDGSLGKAISQKVCEQIDDELAKVVTPRFYSDVSELQANLTELRTTPLQKVTRRKHSEKMFILYWLAITEKAGSGEDDDIFAIFIEHISGIASSLNVDILKSAIDDPAVEVTPAVE